MTKRLLAALLMVSTSAWAEKAAVDAFLGKATEQRLPDVQRMSSAGRAAVLRSAVTSMEPRLGVPKFLWAAPQRATTSLAALNVTPEQAARRYLAQYAELYRNGYPQLAAAKVSGVHDLHDGSAVIVTFQQRVRDVRVFRDEVHVVMNARLELVAISGYLTPATHTRAPFKLSAPTALLTAARDLTGADFNPQLVSELGPGEGGYTRFAVKTSRTPARTRPVYFPMADGLVPGFYVELKLPEAGYYSYVISAATGEVLFRRNLTAHAAFKYRVWAESAAPYRPFDGPFADASPYPGSAPDGQVPAAIAPNLVELENAGLSTNDPWLDDAATLTQGNNVSAYADLGGNDGFDNGDVIADVTGVRAFDRTYDVTQQPQASTDQQKAAVTQLFFNTNFFHDWYYDVGFNEAAGNAQTNNKGRGGAGNDVLLAEAQDFSGTDNANMQTPADGQSPIMQMYVFTGNDEASITLNPVVPGTDAGVMRNPVGADFGPQSFDLTGVVALVDDGVPTTVTATNPFNGSTTTFVTNADGCDPTPWVGDYSGKIVLLDRGLCTFVDKANNAQDAGAAAVIIANNTNGPWGGSLTGTSSTITIPVMAVSLNNGRVIKGDLDAGTLDTATLHRVAALSHDGALDNGVVAHEWGHYISNRLVGDANGLLGNQADGMGEGFGDFHALLMMVKEGDDFDGTYGLAGYAGSAVDPNAFYWGFRRYPISTDFAKNPLTFKHVSDDNALPALPAPSFSDVQNSESHNTGEFWSVALWEVYAALLKDPRHSFGDAQHLMKTYLVSGYKAMPVGPSIVDARDAFLSVMAANDPADYSLAWTAFAKRGLGMGAVAPPVESSTNSPVTESFEVGNDVAITSVTLDDAANSCDEDGSLDGNESGTLHIEISNIGVGALTAATVTVSVSSDTPEFTFDESDTVAVPALAPFSSTTLELPVSLAKLSGKRQLELNVAVADASLLHGTRTQAAVFPINLDISDWSSATDDVEAPSNWTASEDESLTTGQGWRISEEDGNHFWLGPDAASPADVMLTSPALAVGTDPLTITFRHRYEFEPVSQGDYYDGAVIEVQGDSGTWTDVGLFLAGGYTGTIYQGTGQNQSANPLTGRQGYVGTSAGYPAFVNETLSLGTAFANQTVRVRFRVGADDAEGATGWDLDDFTVTGATNLPFNKVVDDADACAVADNRPPDLTVPAGLAVNAGASVTIDATVTDPDGDAVTSSWSVSGVASPTVNGNSVTFVAPTVDQVSYVVRATITATDARGAKRLATTLVTVTNPAAVKKKGCGCNSGFELLPLLGLVLLRGRRKR